MKGIEIFDKQQLIKDLKQIHDQLLMIYKKLFEYKYKNNSAFKGVINNEYKENGVAEKDKKSWNNNFCHRAAYTLLNKILFVRICEDKGFMLNSEDFIDGQVKNDSIGKKLSKAGLQKWCNLITNYTLGDLVNFAFNDIKKSYNNIALYKDDKYAILNPTHDELDLKYLDGDNNLKVIINEFESVLEEIIEKLDVNTYDFSITDGNILGDVYEKFMDRDTRKAIGQFYTPEFVIEYILNNTVAEADVVENPFVTVADISCGSGHFLIMAYDILKEKFISNLGRLQDKYSEDIYILKRNGKEEEKKGKEYWVEENIHYHILKYCIYGADIDSFAVQLTTINLLLKDLDNFTDEINIIECDSLIKYEHDYNYQELEKELGNDNEVVVLKKNNMFGDITEKEIIRKREYYNLTYRDVCGTIKNEKINREKAKELLSICKFFKRKYDYIVGNPPYIPITKINSIKKMYYKKNYIYSEGRVNTFSLFIERALKGVSSCNLAYIIPSRILLNIQYTKIRELLLKETQIIKILDLSEGVFEDAIVDTISIIVKNNHVTNNSILIEKILHNKIVNKTVYQDTFLKLQNSYINIYVDNSEMDLLHKIKNKSVQLESIADIKDGIIQGAVSDLLFIKKDSSDLKKCKKVLVGEDINLFNKKVANKYINYDKELLTKVEDERTKGKGRGLRLRSSKIFERPKILTRQTADRIIAAVDFDNCYYMNTLHGTYIKDLNYNIYYILALMNSKVMYFYYTKYNYEVGKVFAQVKIENLKKLPIIIANDEEQEFVIKLSKQIVKLNSEYQELQYDLNGTKEEIISKFMEIEDRKIEIKAEITSMLLDIDFYLYKLLNLTKAEIELIENTSNSFSEERKLLANKNLYNYKFIKEDSIKMFKSSFNNKEIIDLLVCEENKLESVGFEYTTVKNVREQYRAILDEEILSLYNIDLLQKSIYSLVNKNIMKILIDDKVGMSLEEIINKIQNYIGNFMSIREVLRELSPYINTNNIIVDSIKINCELWKNYIKGLKNNCYIVQYPNGDYYGLSTWTDEIHKKYFIDAFKEYTEVNPNMKKAKDILKLFKDLDIEDKEDYLEVMEEKIGQVFKVGV